MNPAVLISFERLVQHPEATLRQLCLALDIEFEPTMMEAPSRNSRYGGQHFDSTKADYPDEDHIWTSLNADDRLRYEYLLEQCLA